MHWFIIGIFGCVILANIFPSLGANHGPLMPEITVKYVAVSLICFTSGLSLSIKELMRATVSIRVHIFVLAFTFIFFPFLALSSYLFLHYFGVNEWILKGLVILSCMPPPVSSAIILTRAAGGNEAAAMFISMLGSILGILITPVFVLSFLGSTAVVSVAKSVLTLIQTVLLPLMLGQAVQYFRCVSQQLLKLPLSLIGQVALLFIIFTTFCDAFMTHDAPMNASDIIITFLLVVVLQITLLYFSYYMANHFHYLFSREDIVAITFCSTHKSLTLGVPMLRVMFAGYAHFSLITLPLLVYHPTQIVLGGFLAPILKRWVNRKIARKADWKVRKTSLTDFEHALQEKYFSSFKLMPCNKVEDLV